MLVTVYLHPWTGCRLVRLQRPQCLNWPYPRSMDTFLSEVMVFKLFRTETATPTVPSPAIVIALDIIKHRCLHYFPTDKVFSVETFHFQWMKEAFHAGIIVAAALCAHPAALAAPDNLPNSTSIPILFRDFALVCDITHCMNASPFARLPLFWHRQVVAALYPALLQSELRTAMRFADLILIPPTDFMSWLLFRFLGIGD